MTGNLMLAFFVAMPAVVMFVTRHKLRQPLARRVMTYGGATAVGLALIVVIPLLACDGSMLTGYVSCLGSANTSAFMAKAQPLILLAAKIYILIGIPLALLTYAIDKAHQ